MSVQIGVGMLLLLLLRMTIEETRRVTSATSGKEADDYGFGICG